MVELSRGRVASGGCTPARGRSTTWWRRPEAHGDEAWIRTRTRSWTRVGSGGSSRRGRASASGTWRCGARAPVAFLDPADTGETGCWAATGSLTAAEMSVPFVAWLGPDEDRGRRARRPLLALRHRV